MERWYWLGYAVAGRSYCAEMGQAPDYRYEQAGGIVTIYRNDGHTVLATNSDASRREPGALGFSRACWMAPVFEDFLVRVAWNPLAPPPATLRYATLRVVETTMWCPWFFIDGDYSAFTILQNTTKDPVAVTVTWRNAYGVQVGTYAGNIPGKGNLALNARSFVTGATSGSIEVAHDGSPQAIQGSTTTLSGTTGVGFDAVFTQRQPW